MKPLKVDTQELKARITYHNLLQKDVADSLGISKNTFSAKLQSGDFKISEIHKLMKIIPLDMQQVEQIFFSE